MENLQEKEEFIKEARSMLTVASIYASHCNVLVSSLQQVCRSDVSFHSIEATKAVLVDTKDFQLVLKKLQVMLKKRASGRMREI